MQKNDNSNKDIRSLILKFPFGLNLTLTIDRTHDVNPGLQSQTLSNKLFSVYFLHHFHMIFLSIEN